LIYQLRKPYNEEFSKMTKKDKKSGQQLNGNDATLKPLLFCPKNRVHPPCQRFFSTLFGYSIGFIFW